MDVVECCQGSTLYIVVPDAVCFSSSASQSQQLFLAVVYRHDLSVDTGKKDLVMMMLKYYADMLPPSNMILALYKPLLPSLRCADKYDLTTVEGSVCFNRTLQSSMVCAEENP